MPSIYEPPRGPQPPSAQSPSSGLRNDGFNRKTEASDTRLGIREHEDQPRKKRDPQKRDPLTLPEDVYDQATLGVRAVIDFLTKFLKSIENQENSPTVQGEGTAQNIHPDKGTPPPNGGDHTPPPHINPVAARAASAYSHTARASQPQSLQAENGDAAAASSLLQAAEIRQIHALLEKLRRLDQREVVGIKLFKAESFLQSLTNAADAALAKL